MNDYISKPFTLNELADKLTQWLNKKLHLAPIVTFNEAEIENTGRVIERKAWESIRELQRPDQPDILHKLITIYLENSPDLIELLTQYVQDMDEVAFAETAHTLKSSSKNLGAFRLAKLCEKIECNAEVKDQTKAFKLIKEIEAEYQLVETEFKEELGVGSEMG